VYHANQQYIGIALDAAGDVYIPSTGYYTPLGRCPYQPGCSAQNSTIVAPAYLNEIYYSGSGCTGTAFTYQSSPLGGAYNAYGAIPFASVLVNGPQGLALMQYGNYLYSSVAVSSILEWNGSSGYTCYANNTSIGGWWIITFTPATPPWANPIVGPLSFSQTAPQ
jgi:hypothetical protein